MASHGLNPTPRTGDHSLTTGEFINSGNNPFEAFFGKNPGVNLDTTHRDAHTEAWNLPIAYEGKSKYLERQIFWLMNDAEFFVTRLCPWELTDSLHVSWDVWKFDHTLADLEPEQGVPRFVTQQREARSDSLVRRGLAFMVEHGFYKTEEGRQHYLLNLQQIVDAVHTTVYYGVLQALLNAKNHYKEAALEKGYTHTQIEDVMREERERWGIAQKRERGMYVLDARLKDDMSREQITPDVWVFPPRMGIYLTMVPSSEVVYSEHGPGNDRSAAGSEKMLTFRGSEVHEARPIDVDFAGAPRDLLTRDRMIGSYFTMYDHLPSIDNATYESDMRSIYIYDMNADKFKKITLAMALKNCDFNDWVSWCNAGKTPVGGGNTVKGGIPSIAELVKDGGSDFWKRAGMEHTYFKKWAETTDVYTGENFAGTTTVLNQVQIDALLVKEGLTAGRLGAGDLDTVAGLKGAVGDTNDQLKTAKTKVTEQEKGLAKARKDVSGKGSRADKVAIAKAQADLKVANDELVEKLKLRKVMVQIAQDSGLGGAYIHSGNQDTNDGLFNKDLMMKLILSNARIPVAFILARPFQRYQASSAILAKGGKDLGITYHGHHDFQLTDDVVHKTHLGHYTFYSKTIIRNPNHFSIAEDVFCTAYRGGEGCEFFSTKGNGLDIKTAVEEGDPKTKSIFCMVTGGERLDDEGAERVMNPISITGKHVKEDVHHEGLTKNDTHPSAAFYKDLYDMDYWDLGADDPTRFQQEYEKINRCCFQGRQQIYNPMKKDFSNEVLETGHWGSEGTYEGCRAARTGRDVFLKRPDRDPAFL